MRSACSLPPARGAADARALPCLLGIFALAAAASIPGVASSQTLRQSLWVTNGFVSAVATSGNTIYLGGQFTQVGPATGSAVGISAATGAVVQPTAGATGIVYAVASDGSGGWYFGGLFKFVQGQPRSNLAHVDAGGNLTSWSPNADNTVSTLVVSGSTVYVGGLFTSIGSHVRHGIAALDASTGLATSWDPNASAPGSFGIYALAVSNGKVYAGGDFHTIGGQPRIALAQLDAVSGAATSWDPEPNGAVIALSASGNTIYAGGAFTVVGGVARSFIAGIDATTGSITAWAPYADNWVRALAVRGTTVYAGGQFSMFSGQPRKNLAALDAAGTATSWAPNPDGTVCALSSSGGVVYAGGAFFLAGGQARAGLVALDSTTATATSWNPGTNNTVCALATSGGTVYAGGSFTSVGCQVRKNIAAMDTAGALRAWDPNANGYISTLALRGGTVYAAGGFSHIGGQDRNHIAALDAATGVAQTWNPNADGSVTSMTVNGSKVYVAGNFVNIGGQMRHHLAALNVSDGLAATWNPNSNGAADALVLTGSLVYVSGGFTTIGGQPRNRVAAIDTLGVLAPWDPNADDEVSALAVSEGTVYLAGWFTHVGGKPRNHIAAIDAGGLATAWNPNADYNVYALAASGSTVYAGGVFTNIGGHARTALAALDPAGFATNWDPEPDGVVGLLSVNAGMLDVGGSFASIQGFPHSGIAVLGCPSPTTLYRDADGDGYGDPAIATFSCDGSIPAGYVTNNTDCDDSNPAVHPGAREVCDNIDNNCNGQVDEAGLKPGMVSWWPGEGNANDATGSHDGVLRDGVTFDPAGEVGKAFSFNGDYVEVPDSPSLRFTSQYTLEAWIEPKHLNSVQQIMSKWSFAAGNFAYEMGIYPNGALRADVSGTGSTYGELISPPNLLSMGSWAHVAVTFSAGVLDLYINGNLAATHDMTPITSIYPGTTDLFLGVANGGVQYFNGLIDEPATYNRALSAAEIKARYQAGSGGLCAVAGVNDSRRAAGAFEFSAPWPNPSSQATDFEFELPARARVVAEVVDVAGRRVSPLLIDGVLEAGSHHLQWNDRSESGSPVAPGVYLIRISAGDVSVGRRIVLIK